MIEGLESEGKEEKRRRNSAEKKEESAREKRGESVPPGKNKEGEEITTKAASVSGYTGFSETKYKGGFSGMMKTLVRGQGRNNEKKQDNRKETAELDASMTAKTPDPIAGTSMELPQRGMETSTPMMSRKSDTNDWVQAGHEWTTPSSPIIGRKSLNSTRIEADATEGIQVDVSLKLDSSWRPTSSFGEAIGDASFCSAAQMESSRAPSESDMDVSRSSAKQKRRASSRNSENSSDSEFPRLRKDTKRGRKKRVLRDESESRSLDKSKEEENEKNKDKGDLTIDNEAEIDDDTVKRRFAAADTRTLGDRALMWLKELDDMRGKCRNIQGKISGHMKKKIRYAGMAVEDLVIRVSNPTEDVTWMRMHNSELTLKLREAQRETDRLRNELEISRKEKTKLEREMGERMRRLEEDADRIRDKEEQLNRCFTRNEDEEEKTCTNC